MSSRWEPTALTGSLAFIFMGARSSTQPSTIAHGGSGDQQRSTRQTNVTVGGSAHAPSKSNGSTPV